MSHVSTVEELFLEDSDPVFGPDVAVLYTEQINSPEGELLLYVGEDKPADDLPPERKVAIGLVKSGRVDTFWQSQLEQPSQAVLQALLGVCKSTGLEIDELVCRLREAASVNTELVH
jgi:hypothetical protein